MQVLDRAGVGTLWSICKTKFALAGHTHNYAGSGSAGGSANSAVSVVDYGQTSKTIQIGYSGSGITGDQIKYIAGYTSGSGDVNAKIKDVSKDALRSWLGLGSLAYSSTTLGNAAGKNVRTLGSVSHSSWANATTDDQYVPTMSFIAYWNGAYNSSGNSNLQYCSRGKFGALAVKDTADWSQVANKPATATRWPSWGEVTSKPELKNWSETKSYIDSKLSATGGGMIYKSGYGMSVVNDSNDPMDVYESGIDGEIVGKIDELRTKAKISLNNKTYDCFYNFWLKYIYSESLDYLFQKLKINKDVLKTVLNITPSEINSSFGIILLRLNDNVIIEQNKPIFVNPHDQYNKYIIAYKKLTDNGLVDCDSKGNILN